MKLDQIVPQKTDSTSVSEHAGARAPYVWGVDLIRFAAAVMVVLFHLSWQSSNPEVAFSAGWIGVEIFFVISGFVIMGSASFARVATFAKKRIARLYPAAIACAVINFAVLLPFSDLANRYGLAVGATFGRFLSSLLLVKGPFLVGSLWTLPVEISFYALIGLLMVRGWIERPLWIASTLILWSSVYVVPFCLSMYELIPPVPKPPNLTLLRHGCFFGVGILLWVSSRGEVSPGQRMPYYGNLTFGIALCWVEIIARSIELRTQYSHLVGLVPLTLTALASFSAAVIAIWLLSRPQHALQPSPTVKLVMRYLGLVTYPLYLMHEAVGGVTSSLLQVSGYSQGLALVAGLGLSLLVSLFVVVTLEPWLEPRLMSSIHWLACRARIGLRARNST